LEGVYRTQVRIPDAVFEKSKILASIHGVSFNQLVVDLLTQKISTWEAGHGAIPTLPKEDP
jgi:predicted DNA binding CopG/RHH family protein